MSPDELKEENTELRLLLQYFTIAFSQVPKLKKVRPVITVVDGGEPLDIDVLGAAETFFEMHAQ